MRATSQKGQDPLEAGQSLEGHRAGNGGWQLGYSSLQEVRQGYWKKVLGQRPEVRGQALVRVIGRTFSAAGWHRERVACLRLTLPKCEEGLL